MTNTKKSLKSQLKTNQNLIITTEARVRKIPLSNLQKFVGGYIQEHQLTDDLVLILNNDKRGIDSINVELKEMFGVSVWGKARPASYITGIQTFPNIVKLETV